MEKRRSVEVKKMAKNVDESKKKGKVRGITLIALVITIIVLLMLVGVTLSTLSGQDGILNKAATAADRTNKEAIKEKAQIQVYGSYNTTGRLDMDDLSTNIKNNFGNELEEEPKYYLQNAEEEKLRGCLKFVVDGYNVRIDGQGNVTLYKDGEEIGLPSNSDGTKIGKAGEIIPVLKDSTAKRVYWKEDGTEVEEGKDGSEEFIEDEWCDYGNNKWANVKLSDGSYFVWIPRFAYKITNDALGGTPADTLAGTIEVEFIGTDVTAENVKQRLGDGYIVHPAFCDESVNVYENGGWNSELPGIWVAKYEMSMQTGEKHTETSDAKVGDVTTDTTIKAVSKPNVSSWRWISIGNSYTNGMKYDRSKDSHMMKNSEWGAVAYLTHSKYGRDGKEVSVNQSSNYITGAGRGEGDNAIYNETYAEPNEKQKYNGEIGKLSSSTGNISGIYDLSGGAWERVAAFNSVDTKGYETQYGSSFADINKTNTQWATKYSSDNNIPTQEKSKVGDAIWDVYVKSNRGWFNDDAYFVKPDNPFVVRGGHYVDGADTGVFSASNTNRRSKRGWFVPCSLGGCVALISGSRFLTR